MSQSPTATISSTAARIAPAARAGIQSYRIRLFCCTAADDFENESNRASIQIAGGCVVASASYSPATTGTLPCPVTMGLLERWWRELQLAASASAGVCAANFGLFCNGADIDPTISHQVPRTNIAPVSPAGYTLPSRDRRERYSIVDVVESVDGRVARVPALTGQRYYPWRDPGDSTAWIFHAILPTLIPQSRTKCRA